MRKLLKFFAPTIIGCSVVYIIFGTVLLTGFVATDKMEPDIIQNSFIVGNRLAYIHSTPQIGDNVMAKIDNQYYIRVVSAIENDVCILRDANENEMAVNIKDIVAKLISI